MDNTKIALDWWGSLATDECFRLLKKHGYQDEKKPWKYRPLSNKGILNIWVREHEQK